MQNNNITYEEFARGFLARRSGSMMPYHGLYATYDTGSPQDQPSSAALAWRPGAGTPIGAIDASVLNNQPYTGHVTEPRSTLCHPSFPGYQASCGPSTPFQALVQSSGPLVSTGDPPFGSSCDVAATPGHLGLGLVSSAPQERPVDREAALPGLPAAAEHYSKLYQQMYLARQQPGGGIQETAHEQAVSPTVLSESVQAEACADSSEASAVTFSRVDLEDVRAAAARHAGARERGSAEPPSSQSTFLALVGDVGNLSKVLRLTRDGDVVGLRELQHRERMWGGMADVLLALVQMADVCGVDLGDAVKAKLRKTETKDSETWMRSPDATGDSSHQRHMGGDSQQRHVGEPWRGHELPAAIPQQQESATTPPANGSHKRPLARSQFTQEQVAAMTRLAEESNWNLNLVPNDVRERFCARHDVTKKRLQNFFSNRKPQELKRRIRVRVAEPETEPSTSPGLGLAFKQEPLGGAAEMAAGMAAGMPWDPAGMGGGGLPMMDHINGGQPWQ